MKKLPRKVWIAGKKIRVVFKELADGLHGQYSHDEGVILMARRYRKKATRMAWDTLLHEMIHASLDIGAVSFALDTDLEEAVVRNIEQLFLPALRKIT